MSDDSNKDGSGGKPARPRRKSAAPTRDVGNVLKGVWQRTVSEAVPDDLLDLLRKLD